MAKPGDAVMCQRNDLMPKANDFKVLVAGFPLIISGGDGRIAVLEIDSGKVQFRTLQGGFTNVEIPIVQNYLDRASDAINGLDP